MAVSASASNIIISGITDSISVYLGGTGGTIAANIGTISGTAAIFFSPSVPTVTANAGTGTLTVKFDPGYTLGAISNTGFNVNNSPTVTANAGTGSLTVRLDPGYTLGNVLVTNTPTVTANAGTGTLTIRLDPGYTLGNVGLNAGINNVGDIDVLTLPALPAGTNNIGDVDVLTMPSTADLDTGVGTDTRLTVGLVAAAAGGAVNIGGDVTNGLDVDVTRMSALVAGTANIGDVDVLTLPALVAGTANIGDVDIVTMPNVTLAAGTNTNEIVGDVAHDIAVAGNPIRIAGRGVSADYTAVATGDTTDLITDLNGKQIILPYAIPENFVNGVATLTAITDAAVIAAGGVGIRNYITSISASNTSATNVRVDFKDGTTIVASFFVAASGGGATHTMPVPIRGTANTAFNAALSAAVTDCRVSAQGYRAP